MINNALLHIKNQVLAHPVSVFISMDHDLGCQVSLKSMYHNSFIIPFHRRSLLYERVSLFGITKVKVIFPHKQPSMEGFLYPFTQEGIYLLLALDNTSFTDDIIEHAMIPIT